MIIVYVADENYIGMVKKSMVSYRKYNPSAHFVVVSERPLKIDDMENIVIPVKQHRGITRVSNATFLKLYLPQLPYDKVLYVDGDTLCQAPLDELWNMDCEKICLCESHDYGKKQANELGHKKYGLAGVMLMNLKALRNDNFTEKCLEAEKTCPELKTGWHQDETCINVAYGDSLTFIDQKWDYCHNRSYEHGISERDACILHFIGKDKSDMDNFPQFSSIQPVLDYLKDKNVAIVGNAQSIFDHTYGEEIDKADVVIRFNRGFPNDIKAQGEKTTILMLSCDLSKTDINFYKAKYVINRSGIASNDAPTISSQDRNRLAEKLGSQPSSGFMAIDLCLTAHAKSIQLYGFDFEQTPTFYNPDGYKTKHDYNKEQEIVLEYERAGLLTINKGE